MQVFVGSGDELALFFAVDSQMSGLYVAGSARFDFDKAEDISFPANEVDFTAAAG